ncbi:probable palmitoyltransferase ZDHHC11 [Bombyx mandarina]|uniref:Palmitoyltransferase n=1 Tax=Bombyx mandarina TaxID=7092 RepID=A0A6J2JE47_BOMMA|nr:probable palmitoyltransferase ZDHHC11 [Bombyx mandarina]
MAECCIITNSSPRLQRRLNGFQLPLNYLQVLGWIALIGTALINFIFLIQIQFNELRMISLIVYTVLYVSHTIAHVTASMLDPSETELRKMEINIIPEFDRTIHAHVIENGRCHLCNIQATSRYTKHCSICNKCVDQFDHHCKWLNNCIGNRNYLPFIASVITALMISAFTAALCLTDIVLFLTNPYKLSTGHYNYINCTISKESYSEFCKISMPLLAFLVLFFIIAIGISCALLHLCCFHVYISYLGVSTYEYVMKSGTSEAIRCQCFICKCRRISLPKMYIKDNTKPDDEVVDKHDKPELIDGLYDSETRNGSNLIVLVNNQLDRARNWFVFDRNKVHPHNVDSDR